MTGDGEEGLEQISKGPKIEGQEYEDKGKSLAGIQQEVVRYPLNLQHYIS